MAFIAESVSSVDAARAFYTISATVRTFDFTMTHKLDTDDFFIQCVQRRCAETRMNFFLIEPLWVDCFFDKLIRGEVTARVLLNMHSEHHQPDEIFHRLVRAMAERGVQVIDPPEVALNAFDKARLHKRLLAAGIPVPPTVIVRREQVTGPELTAAQMALLGLPFVIKPSMGYGRRGVVLDAQSIADLARSIAAWNDTAYLLQQRIKPRDIGGEPAYFRVFNAFGTTWCCWWNCFTDRFRGVSEEEMERLSLGALPEISRQIAALTGMRFFSTEVAQTDSGEFVVIDYVNDQCYMLSQSADPQKGVPDDVVAGVAARLVEGAKGLINAARK